MNAFARTAAVLTAAAGLALGLAPVAGATTVAPAAVAAPDHHHDHPWREGQGYGGAWGGPCGGMYFYQGYWYDQCGNVMTSDPDNSQPSGGDDDD